jgi:hypothetical protein
MSKSENYQHTLPDWGFAYCGKDRIKIFKKSDDRRIATVIARNPVMDEANAAVMALAPEMLSLLKVLRSSGGEALPYLKDEADRLIKKSSATTPLESSVKIKLERADTSRGAPMGRPSEPLHGRCAVQLMRMSDGAYDAGGAYWGCGTPQTGYMYVAQDPDGHQAFTRARSREEAKDNFRKENNGVTFYV